MKVKFLTCSLALFLSAGIAYTAAPNTGTVRSSVDTIYKVVINVEGAYSIWPADRENPLGWDDAGKTGTKEECLAWIKEQGETEKTPGPEKIKIPTQAQNGRNLELTGSFDGNAKTTAVTIDGQRAEVLEETASKSLVKIPSNLKGQVKVTVEEGSNKAEGTCNVINVDVTATQTNLLKGESAIVTVIVTGLDGIKRTIPLHLTTKGVINMEGGNAQLLRIHPGDVQGGRYTITRKITGRQAGGFDVTATVVTKPSYITLVKDAKDNGWRAKKDGNGFVFTIENVKDPLKGGLLEGEYVLETGCLPGTQIKSLIPVLVKQGKGQVSGALQPNGFASFPFLGGTAGSFEMGRGCPGDFFGYPGFNAVIGSPINFDDHGRSDPPVNDPSKPSPNATYQLIQLTENAGENGFRLKKSGKSWRAELENVKDPKKGDPLEGEYVVEYRCVPGTLIQTQVLVFKKGRSQLELCPDIEAPIRPRLFQLGLRF